MMSFFRTFFLAASAALLPLAASAQFQLASSFSGPTEPGWRLQGGASFTAPATDPAGSGWLRLTGNQSASHGAAVLGGAISVVNGLTIRFTHVAWGGGSSGAEGLALVLFEAGANLDGAAAGAGLGYCRGAGGWLAVALDEAGGFANPAAQACGKTGPGVLPQSVTVRGPVAAGHPFILNAALSAGVDAASATVRPAPREFSVSLQPRPGAGGYWLNVDWRHPPEGPWTRLMERVELPFAAPALLQLGFTATTGSGRNVHELRGISLAGHAPALPVLRQRFEPAQIAVGGATTLVFEFAGRAGQGATLLAPLRLQLPPGLVVANPPGLGGDCPGALSAAPGSSQVVVAAGAGIRAGGCSLSVQLRAQAPGELATQVPVGALQTDKGRNILPVDAKLVVLQ